MSDAHKTPQTVSLSDFQRLIREMYFEKDVARGVDGTFMWLMEEVGELAAALREGNHQQKMEVGPEVGQEISYYILYDCTVQINTIK